MYGPHWPASQHRGSSDRDSQSSVNANPAATRERRLEVACVSSDWRRWKPERKSEASKVGRVAEGSVRLAMSFNRPFPPE